MAAQSSRESRLSKLAAVLTFLAVNAGVWGQTQPATQPTQPPATAQQPAAGEQQAPEQPQQPDQAADQQADLGEAPTSSPSSYSPNMFGDFFGGRAWRVVFGQGPLVVPGRLAKVRQFSATVESPPGSNIPAPFTPEFGTRMLVTQAAPLGIGGFPLPQTTFIATSVFTGLPSAVTLRENPDVTAVVAANVARPGEVVDFNSGLAVFLGMDMYAVGQVYDLITPGTPSQLIPQAPLVFSLPNPAGGGVAGRSKVSEDNNPIPRDRVIFDYDYFNNVPLAADGFNVNRFAPGIEKTFLDGQASVAVSLPFAATLDGDVSTTGLTSTDAELGNLFVTLKALVYSDETFFVATGLGVAIPTAADTRLQLPDGTDLIRIDNEAYLLMPFIGVLFTPDERWFAATWVEVGVDCNGNPVRVNPSLTGLVGVGELTDATLILVDAQVGYWLVRDDDPSAFLRGLAAFVELHYNTAADDPEPVRAGPVVVGDFLDGFDELNLTLGLVAQVGTNLNLGLGAVVPLSDGDDRFFDYQVGVRANWFFGATARSREPAVQVSGF